MDPSARRVLILLSIAESLAMSLWFTGTAVLPQLSLLWGSGIAAYGDRVFGAWSETRDPKNPKKHSTLVRVGVADFSDSKSSASER